MTSICKGDIALAQSEQTARLEMVSGLSQYSEVLSLMRVVVSEELPCCSPVD